CTLRLITGIGAGAPEGALTIGTAVAAVPGPALVDGLPTFEDWHPVRSATRSRRMAGARRARGFTERLEVVARASIEMVVSSLNRAPFVGQRPWAVVPRAGPRWPTLFRRS